MAVPEEKRRVRHQSICLYSPKVSAPRLKCINMSFKEFASQTHLFSSALIKERIYQFKEGNAFMNKIYSRVSIVVIVCVCVLLVVSELDIPHDENISVFLKNGNEHTHEIIEEPFLTEITSPTVGNIAISKAMLLDINRTLRIG